MPQTFVHPDKLVGDGFSLDQKESHHVVRVLRKKAGDRIELFDGQGGRYIGELTRVQTGEAVLGRIVETLSAEQKKTQIHLFQGIPRGSKFDFVIEKAVELGVDSILPFTSEKNPIQSETGASKTSRWSRLAEAAAKQCGRATVPTIHPAVKLQDLSSRIKPCSLLLEVGPDVEPIRTVLLEIKKDLPREINVIVGPESGFSDKENAWLVEQGGLPVSLGGLTLRTETAGLVALSLVNYELGLLK